jgi:uncharacterized membrane protein YfcA
MDFPISLLDALYACGIALLGSTLQGSIGFGLGLIGVPILVLIDPSFVPGPLLLSALMLTLLIAFREHRAIDVKGIAWAISGRILGAILGILILKAVPPENFSLLFGVMVLIAVFISLGGIDLSINPKNLLGAGTASGLMGTTSAIGGAPMALLYQKHKGPSLRGNLSSIFIFGTIISLVSLTAIGRFRLHELQMTCVLIPGVILGFLFSSRMVKVLDKGFIRPAVLIASAASGTLVILKSIF